MIILAVQGSGKSYAAAKRNDSADIDRIRGKESLEDYIDRLLEAAASKKYTLGNLRLDIAEELDRRGEQFTLFAPFRDFLSTEEYQEIKERIFGRLVLRKEQNERTCRYIEDFKSGYDKFNNTAYYDGLSGNESYICMDRVLNTVAKLLEFLDNESDNGI